MPLKALLDGRELIAPFLDEAEWATIAAAVRDGAALTLPCRGAAGGIRRSKLGRRFFYHRTTREVPRCAWAGETAAHLDWPLADRAALGVLVTRLVANPLAQVAHRGLGVTRATIDLGLEGERVRARVRLSAPTTSALPLVAALLAEADRALARLAARDADDAAEAAAGITSVALALTAPRPLPIRQASFFDVPQGRAGRVLAGLERARRRADSPIGYFRPLDPTDPRPERRYALDPVARPPEAAT